MNEITSLRDIPRTGSAGLSLAGTRILEELKPQKVGKVRKRRFRFECAHCGTAFIAMGSNIASRGTVGCGCQKGLKPYGSLGHTQRMHLSGVHLGHKYNKSLCREWRKWF